MNRCVTEVTTDDASEFCVSEKDSNLQSHPMGTPVWRAHPSDASLPGVFPLPHQRFIQLGKVDPQGFSSEPGPPGGSHHTSLSSPWFTNEPIPCNLMLGDLLAPGASLYVPQVMDHRPNDGLTEFTPRLTQPVSSGSHFRSDYMHTTEPAAQMLYNVSDGLAVGVHPSEPEPVFLDLKSATQHREDSQHQSKAFTDVSILGPPSQFPQYHQTACDMHVYRDQRVSLQPSTPPAQTESKSRKSCHCTKSQCLKLYCECFANGEMCKNCDCSNCNNNPEHEMKRCMAIKSCLGRNPAAFRSKIAGWKSKEAKGCNCKRSNCLKNYCECYEANIKCSSSCKCVGCRNYDDKDRQKPAKDKWPLPVITFRMVEAVCGFLLAQAAEAERQDQDAAQAERLLLDEFGHCLTQIVKSMYKTNTH